MQIVGRHAIDGVLRLHPRSRRPMARWLAIAGAPDLLWTDIKDTRRTFPTADAIKGTALTCFNIGGNSYRLLTIISYSRGEIVIHELLTHAEYTRKYT